MDLTICVCVRDGAPYVDGCLRALIAETAPYATPIVVVDHASRDDTAARLARWVCEHPTRLATLHFAGQGIAAARNFAWRQSRTPWVAFVDIDCTVRPGWANAAYDALQFHAPDAQCGAFGGTNLVPHDGRLLYRAYSVALSTYVGGYDSLLNRQVLERCRVNHCPTLNVVYRRSALEAIGGFDPAFTRVCEDLDVSRRLLRTGHTLWANPEMSVEHALRPTLPAWLRNMFLYGRGHCFQLKRHPADFHPKFLAPAAVVLAYAAAAGLDIVRSMPAFRLAALASAHFASIALLLAAEARRQRAGLAVWIMATVVVWLTHLGFGSGLWFELPRQRDKFF